MSRYPERLHQYNNQLMDSDRWDRITPRSDDIIISTPYKAGTTWTQRICSLLIFQTTELHLPVTKISPWVDVKFLPADEMTEIYESQKHRRFFKTHTPLTGIPYHQEPSYIVCGRDPRDIFLSMQNHYENMDSEKYADMLKLTPEQRAARNSIPDDLNERFKLWLTKGSFDWEADGFPFWSTFTHYQSFWSHRQMGNIYFIHYDNLLRDLDGEMRKLAEQLDIQINEEVWPELVDAATFDAMKKDHQMTAPNAQIGLWKDPAKFFNRGTSGQWQDVLSDENLALYDDVKAARMEPSLVSWLEVGSSYE